MPNRRCRFPANMFMIFLSEIDNHNYAALQFDDFASKPLAMALSNSPKQQPLATTHSTLIITDSEQVFSEFSLECKEQKLLGSLVGKIHQHERV